jgi:hypothetical protein
MAQPFHVCPTADLASYLARELLVFTNCVAAWRNVRNADRRGGAS